MPTEATEEPMSKKSKPTTPTTPTPHCIHEETREVVIMVALRTRSGGAPSRVEGAAWDTLLAAQWYLQQKGLFEPVMSVQAFLPDEFEPVRVMAENAISVKSARLDAQNWVPRATISAATKGAE